MLISLAPRSTPPDHLWHHTPPRHAPLDPHPRPQAQAEREIRAQGVTRLRRFGSMARGEAGPKSDVDLLADIDRGVKFS